MSGIITSLKVIRDAADEAIELAGLGETTDLTDLFDRIGFIAVQGNSLIDQSIQLLSKPAESAGPGKQHKMSLRKSALLIRCLIVPGGKFPAPTQKRLVDIEALACVIANDLQPIQDESSEPTES